ncbi:MAG: polysaccharide pyruvyl transferase family protein [Paludibacteraceae bacterium]|nr:polysaccharide pyruvyl transferase family protein [Paludibacteraceae bacterium]
MVFQLSGIETNNKGAELMLYAILQEIERRFGKCQVYMPTYSGKKNLSYIQTNHTLKYKKWSSIVRVCKSCHITGVVNRSKYFSSMLNDTYLAEDVGFFIDASGLFFSDKMIKDSYAEKYWDSLLRNAKKKECHIVFLPQAFGPFDNSYSKNTVNTILQYSDIVFSRDKVSSSYLESIQKHSFTDKILEYPDFTSLVDGVIPDGYNHLKDLVCIIPNVRMVEKGVLTEDEYIQFITKIAASVKNNGLSLFFLNHEGFRDECLAKKINERLNNEFEVVSGLNALEVKGLISQSYLCISSRFHGVASALNSYVPCLATSWSHKYKELFRDYGLNDNLLPLHDISKSLIMIENLISQKGNVAQRQILETTVPLIKSKTKEMWNIVWNI